MLRNMIFWKVAWFLNEKFRFKTVFDVILGEGNYLWIQSGSIYVGAWYVQKIAALYWEGSVDQIQSTE